MIARHVPDPLAEIVAPRCILGGLDRRGQEEHRFLVPAGLQHEAFHGLARMAEHGARWAVLSKRPLPPFDDWPAQYEDERIGYVWYAEPAAFVLQATVEHGTSGMIEQMNDLIDGVLETRADAVRAASGLFIFHDWRSISGYDAAARARQIERMRARARGYARRTVVAIAPKSRLLRMGIEAVNLFSVLTFKASIEVVTDPVGALERAGIRKPEPGATFPATPRRGDPR